MNAIENGDESAAMSLAEIEAAYETLADRRKRREYDARLAVEAAHRSALGPSSRLWDWWTDLSMTLRAALLLPFLILAILLLPSRPHEPIPAPLTEAEKKEYREREERNSPVPITEKQLDARNKEMRETEESLRRLTGTQNQNLSERDEERIRRATEKIVDNKRRWAQ